MNIQYNIFRWLVFKIGDTKWLGWKHLPFIATWAVAEHKIDLNEIDIAKSLIQEGDIILHRDEWFLSNCSIPGTMIHAGIVVENKKENKGLIPYQIIEAVSEGVVERNVGHILQSDYACILRPKLSKDHKAEAAHWARKIVGSDYDVLFDFNSEEERVTINNNGKAKFCCTEIPHFCYLEHVHELGIFRKRNINIITKLLSLIGLCPGNDVVTADMYVESHGFDFVWVSKNYTVEWAKKELLASEGHIFKLNKHLVNGGAVGQSNYK
jgi:hypothetical protein